MTNMPTNFLWLMIVSSATVFVSALELELYDVDVIEADAATPWDQNGAIEHGYTKVGETLTPETCYHSKYTGDAGDNKVHLKIPTTHVSYVKVLNRVHPSLAFKFRRTSVTLKLDGEITGNCERPAASGFSGSYYKFSCGNARANMITIENPEYYTIFCEVEIKGAKNLASVDIIEAEAAIAWDESDAIEHGYTKVGEPFTPQTCYHSKYKGNAGDNKVHLKIPTSEVSYVRLLNRVHSSASRFTNTEVSLFLDGVYVDHCGRKAYFGASGKWYEFPCQLKTANEVVIQNDYYYTIFCEVDIIILEV